MYIKKIYLNKPHFSYTNTVVSLFEEKKAIEVIMHLQILISNTFFFNLETIPENFNCLNLDPISFYIFLLVL